MKNLTNPCRRWTALIGILMASMVARAECTLQSRATTGGQARAGASTVMLGEADNAISPSAWQGPLVAGACTFELGIIEPPRMLAPANLLYVPTYSGSVRMLTLVDLNTCSVRCKSAAFSSRLKIGPRALDLGGKRIALDARCLPLSKNKKVAGSARSGR